MNKKIILYYTDNRIEDKLAKAVQEQLKKAKLPIISVSLKPIDFGRNICVPFKRGIKAMTKQILIGLEFINRDIVFFAEHDVFYHPSHFDIVPKDKDIVYYNNNVWNYYYNLDSCSYADDIKSWNPIGNKVLYHRSCRLSQLCAFRKTLLEHYRKKIDIVNERGFSMKLGFEPGTHKRSQRVDDLKKERWYSKYPNIDIRHKNTLTAVRWRKDQFRQRRATKIWEEKTLNELKGWDNFPL